MTELKKRMLLRAKATPQKPHPLLEKKNSASFPLGIPMALSATVTFPGSVTVNPSPIRTPDLARLQVPYDAPFLLEELRVQVSGVDAAAALPAYSAPIHKYMFMRLAIDSLEICDFYPIWLLGPVVDIEADCQRDQTTAYLVAATRALNSSSKWRLPKPMFLKPGQTIVPYFQARGQSTTNPFGQDTEVDITAVGRLLPPGTAYPDTVAVPYAALAAMTTTPVVNTFTTELANKFDTRLYVQRFIYRSAITADVDGLRVEDSNFLMPAGGLDAVEMEIDGPRGWKVSELYPQATELFGNAKHHWSHGVWLNPSERFVVRARQSGTVSYADTSGCLSTFGMQGYREVKL